MKKVSSVLLSILLSAALLTGCASPSSSTAPAETTAPETSAPAPVTTKAPAAVSDPVDIRALALKGPTAMGMVKFMSDADAGSLTDNRYSFSIVAAPEEATTKIAKGEVDIAAVPANLASVLFNNTKGAVQVLAVNTLGVIYVVESGDTVKSVEDLRGKTIYATGKGKTPENALNYVLSANGINPESDLTIEWKNEPAECLAAISATENAIAMLPQPFVTTAQMKNDKIRIALDLTKEWDATQANAESPSALLTGVVIARKDFVDANPAAVSAFLDHYKASVEFVNGNVADAAELVGKYEIVPAPVAQKAIPYCNITFIEGAELKAKLSGYLSVLLEQNPQSVGGALPTDEFYYAR